jgi:hypothetical protein
MRAELKWREPRRKEDYEYNYNSLYLVCIVREPKLHDMILCYLMEPILPRESSFYFDEKEETRNKKKIEFSLGE